MKIFKMYFRFLDLLLPAVAARKIYHVMSNPRIHKLRDFEEEVLQHSEKERISFKKFQIQKYSWGDRKNKTALLIHGWEGQAGNFGALIDLLLNKGFHMVAYDAPSHGRSTKEKTSMFEYAEFVTEILKQEEPQIIISHSFGSVTAAFALKGNPGVNVDQWFLVTTPYHFRDRINEISEFLGVTHRTIDKLTAILERDLGISLDKLNMAEYGGNLKNLKEAFIIHSRTDGVIPIDKARLTNQAIPQSRLIELDNLGHYRILWSKQLKEILVEVIT
jgi:pimeloyl-ACP methyl ester carboxylesterase